MKLIDIIDNYKLEDIKTVICKADGLIHTCNPLAVDGTCVIKDCLCKSAVAVIVEQNGFTQYLAIEH